MKTLTTHFRPHLDDICAMWLMKRFLPEAKDAGIDFMATGPGGGKPVDDPELVYVGVGRGRFDEHKGDVGKCATSLVFDYVKEKVAFDPLELRAVAKIVDWVLLEDTGKLNTIEQRDFTVPVLIELYPIGPGSDVKVSELGFAILDGILVVQRNAVLIEDDWSGRKEFASRYGKAVAIGSGARKIDTYAYANGFDLAVIADPARHYLAVRASADSDIDLTPLHEQLKTADAGAAWYFHHSKKMLICGGDRAPDATPSSLALEQLIELMK